MMQVLNLRIAVLTASACLLLSSVQGGHLASRRSRGDRERRQGYSEGQMSSAEGAPETSRPGVLYSVPTVSQQSQPFAQPELPALYSPPRSAEQGSPNSAEEEGQVGNQASESPQATTPEPSSTPSEDSSQPPRKLEEGVSEEYPGEVTNPGEIPILPTMVTQEEQPTSRGQEQRTAENDIRGFGGYSGPGNYVRMKVRGQDEVGRESEVHNNQQLRKFNLIMENFIPHSFSNEIPRVYSVLQPNDQQQVENTFYTMRPIPPNEQRLMQQEEGFRHIAAFRQPIRNDYVQRPQEIQYATPPQPQGGYDIRGPPSPMVHRHRILEGTQYPMGNQNPAPAAEDASGRHGMSLEGLDNHIVDSNLLDRVQQIIDNHERQQRDFLKRFQQQEKEGQAQFPNGNAGRVPSSQGGYSAAGRNQEYPRNEKLARNGAQQGTLSAANFYQQPQEPTQGESTNLFRKSKSFPGNPNLEFQPAILTGHFEERNGGGLVRVGNMAGERTNGNEVPRQEQPQQQYYQPQAQQQQQPQQNVQYQTPEVQGQVNFPRLQEQYPQQQFYSSPLPMSNGQRQGNAETYRQQPVELPYVHRSPPGSISAEQGQDTFPSQPKPEEGFLPNFMSPKQGYKEEEGRPNPYVYNPEKSAEGKGNENSLEVFSEFQQFSGGRKEVTPEYLPPGAVLGGRGKSAAPQFQGGNQGPPPRVNPNVITRTIVVHEQPAGTPGLSNRAILTGDDTGRGNSQFYSSPSINQPQVISDGNEVEGSQQPMSPQFQFLSASAQLAVGDQERGPGGYNGPPQSNVPPVPAMSQEEVEKPRPVYGIPIAPVLGPESLDDSVVVDARGVQLPNQVHSVPQGSSASRDPNVFGLYRLPTPGGNPGGYSITSEQEPSNSSPTEQRRRDVNFQQFQGAQGLRSRNFQKRFSPVVISPLAGYFSSKS